MNDDAEQFLTALGAGLGAEERIILCGVPGDPGTAPPTAWRPRPWHPEHTGGIRTRFPVSWNGYATVGAFSRAEDGSYRRRAAHCTAGLALMVDDVGTKVPRTTVSILTPTARVETSPGNEQWWYMLAAPERDVVRFDAVIRAFISGRLLGHDPGMASVTRVGRLPGFQNLKPQYGGWEVALRALEPDRRFTVEELLAEFDLTLVGRREPPRWVSALTPEELTARAQAYEATEQFLRDAGLLKRSAPDPSGWTEMTCPWVDEHTGGVNNGAAIREPYEENSWYGAFRCHHGSHQDRAWRDLTDWVAEQAAEQLDALNKRESDSDD